MSISSIEYWEWLKCPRIIIDGGFVSEGCRGYEPKDYKYYPGLNVEKIINAASKIKDKNSALNFVNNWGILGLSIALKRQTRRDHVTEMIDFGNKVGIILKIKYLLDRYIFEDHLILNNEMEEWIDLFSESEQIKYFNNIFRHDLTHEKFLKEALYNFRSLFSIGGNSGVQIKFHSNPNNGGMPVFHFDSLSRFIEFMVLVEQPKLQLNTPVCCADPKCNKLFFPNRAGQRYCPPPPGVKRSRCEQRHYKSKKKAH